MTKEYYERHKEERRAYQREYARKKFGYKSKSEKKPGKSEEQKRLERNARAREYYHKNAEKCRERNKTYYHENRDYYLEKSRERYKRICAEKYGF